MLREIQNGYVKVETQNGITTIEFNHPQSNALPGKILRDLTREIGAAAGDLGTKVIVLRSGGDRVFCAGASFDELLAIKNEKEGLDFFSGFAHLINEMRRCPKFIIVRVHGKCVGGGVGLVAAADYAIAVQNAEIKLSELAIGIGPFVVGPAVERKMGLSAFTHLAIDASRWRDADWAHINGLYAELHSDAAAMDQSLMKLAESLGGANPEAIRKMKEIFWHGTDHWDTLLMERAAISGKLILSSESRKALEQFKKK
jgi:methylglutaconyl-CoA hydratase